MKIFNDATSPFGRKAVVAAIERKIPGEEVFVDLAKAEFLDAFNPLRQIPTLLEDNGMAVFDSDVIMLHLDHKHSGKPLVPADIASAVLTRMSLANGLMEATMSRIMELRKPEHQRSSEFTTKMEARISRGLEALNAALPSLKLTDAPPRADQITVGVALEYVDFRFADTWRKHCPALAEWAAVISARKSMMLTVPTRRAAVDPKEFGRS